MVVHSGIDGLIRLIVYLSCSTNNKIRAVLHLFDNVAQCSRLTVQGL